MARTNSQHKTISVVIGNLGAAERDYLSGIFRFANAQANWSLELYKTQEELERRLLSPDRPEGVIVALPHATTWGKNALCTELVPAVFIDIPTDAVPIGPNRSFVRLDDRQIGVAAAEHLLSRGNFNSFLCVIDQPWFKYPHHREVGFLSRLKKEGKSLRTIVISESAIDKRETEALRLTLARMPRPLAIFAVRDRAAIKIFDVCRRFSFAIPDEVAVLGVDNDELFCKSLKPSLSSVLPDHEQVGYLAARELGRLMRRGDGREIVCKQSVRDVVMRESTRLIPPSARIISQALDFIEKNASGQLRVSDVARHVGVSRRLIDLRFRQIRGGTILEAIVQARVNLMKKKLLTSSERLESLSAACGFSSHAAFTRFFTTHVGISPKLWRQQRT